MSEESPTCSAEGPPTPRLRVLPGSGCVGAKGAQPHRQHLTFLQPSIAITQGGLVITQDQ